jgi:ribonuclease P protein subunit RPR2
MENRRKKVIKSSVRSSIGKLIGQAQKAYREGKKERSSRYVKMALDLVKKHKIRLPKELKNSFCRKCNVVWIPGKTVKISYDKKNVCLRVKCQCGHAKRL